MHTLLEVVHSFSATYSTAHIRATLLADAHTQFDAALGSLYDVLSVDPSDCTAIRATIQSFVVCLVGYFFCARVRAPAFTRICFSQETLIIIQGGAIDIEDRLNVVLRLLSLTPTPTDFRDLITRNHQCVLALQSSLARGRLEAATLSAARDVLVRQQPSGALELAQVDTACFELFAQQQALLQELGCLTPRDPNSTSVIGAYQRVVLEVPCALLPADGLPATGRVPEVSPGDLVQPSSPAPIDSDTEAHSSDMDMSFGSSSPPFS